MQFPTDLSASAFFRLGSRGLSPAARILTDLLLSLVILILGTTFWLTALEPKTLIGLAAIILAGQVSTFNYSGPECPPRLWLAKHLFGNLVAIAAYCMLRGWFDHAMSRATFAVFVAVFFGVQAGVHLCSRPQARSPAHAVLEPLRWMLLAAALLLLHRPLLSRGSVGAGDAYWYNIMVADFVSQWREGVFPVFVGQSEFAFNGAISPLRLAPALQHFAGLVDLVTAHSLTFHGLLNLTLLACLAGGGFTCYACLRAIEPRAPWLALVLSALYSSCPGLLALAYSGDLFMSITAVPFVPLLFYGTWRTLARGDLRGVVIMSSAAAALWYCHPPIALWATGLAALMQVFRLFREGAWWSTWRNWLVGAGCFVLLALYCGVSVQTLDLLNPQASRSAMIGSLTAAFPSTFQPLGAASNWLAYYQLGWALWLALIAGIMGLRHLQSRRPAFAFLCAITVVLLFLVPGPVMRTLWMTIPQKLCDITFLWPMQRLYIVLAGLVTFLAFITLGPLSASHRQWGALLLAVFLGGAGWAGFEAQKFHVHVRPGLTTPAVAQQQLRSQNRILTRYAFTPLRDIPPYFSHGFIDPRVPNRLLAPGTFTEIVSNQSVLEQPGGFGVLVQQGSLDAVQADPNVPRLLLEPFIRLEPHRTYALTIDFAHPEFTGVLVLSGSSLERSYSLPHSGYNTETTSPSRAFGTLPGMSHTLTLWTDGEKADTPRLAFFFSGPEPAGPMTPFGHFALREIDPDQFPIAIKSWIPYRARVNSPRAAYLETPRLYLDGYRARVNGTDIEVARSSDGLVMFPVPAGESNVELSFHGTWLLRGAYFLSLTGWLIMAALELRHRGRHFFQRV